MKRFVYLICLLAIFLSACSAEEQCPTIPEENYKYGIYQLTFYAKNIYNDHVGNDWSFTYTYNGKTIKSGYKITKSLETTAILTIGVEVRENDKIDDIGNGTVTVAIYDGGSGKAKIKVTETDGRYKGYTTVWEIVCKAKLVGKQ